MISQHRTSNLTYSDCGCGCGGHGTCKCGTTAGVCDPCTEQGFCRPKFFAGQLLTEEDLQAVIQYVVDKNRLTNRHLFGEGVVCGLQVGIDPCDPRNVIVQPGHALDCCGNDIVVSCETPLDILDMLRDLRAKLRGGYDCGDPCNDAPEETVVTADPDEPVEIEDPISTTTPDDFIGSAFTLIPNLPTNEREAVATEAQQPKREPLVHLDLLIRYCESEGDHIARYDVEEPCSASSCEATRICEGFRFELRCHEERPAPKTFQDMCPSSEQEALSVILRGDTAGRSLGHVLNVLDLKSGASGVIDFTDDDLKHTTSLEETLGNMSDVDFEDASAEDVQGALGLINLASSAAMKFNIASNRAEFMARSPEVEELIGNTLSRAYDIYGNLSSRTGAMRSKVDMEIIKMTKLDLDETMARSSGGVASLRDKAIASNVAFSDEEPALVLEHLRAMQDRLVDMIVKQEFSTYANLADRIADVRLDLILLSATPTEDDTRRLVAASNKLRGIARVVLNDCPCWAYLPPCPPCDDQSVRIACLKVSLKKCMIVEICNLCRLYVASGPALRYWKLDGWRGRLERWHNQCCPPATAPDRYIRTMDTPSPEVGPEPTEESGEPPVTLYKYALYDKYSTTILKTDIQRGDPSPELLIGNYLGINFNSFRPDIPTFIDIVTDTGLTRSVEIMPELHRSRAADLLFRTSDFHLSSTIFNLTPVGGSMTGFERPILTQPTSLGTAISLQPAAVRAAVVPAPSVIPESPAVRVTRGPIPPAILAAVTPAPAADHAEDVPASTATKKATTKKTAKKKKKKTAKKKKVTITRKKVTPAREEGTTDEG